MAESRLGDFKNLFREKRTWRVTDIENRLGISHTSVYRLRDQLYSREQISLEANIRDDDGRLMRSEHVQLGCLSWPEATPIEEDVGVQMPKSELEALKAAVAQTEHLTPLLKSALKTLGQSSAAKKQLKSEPVIYNPQVDRYDAALFEKVSKAILDRRIALVTYENAQGQQKTYKFNAYKLVSSNHHLHLVGVSHNSLEAGFDTVIRLRLDKITDFRFFYEKNKAMYFKKPNFNVQDYAHREFGPFSAEGEPVNVRVKFSPEKAHYIERTKRHKSQKVIWLEDGSVLWEIGAPLTDDLVYWVVGYGPHARVLEPRELREKVVAWAQGSVDANS